MNRRTFLQSIGATALGLSVFKLSAQSDDAPDLSQLTMTLYTLPDGDWEIYLGIDTADRVTENVRSFPEQIPARKGVVFYFPDVWPYRLDERRNLLVPSIRRKIPGGTLITPNPAWVEAPYERVFALQRATNLQPIEFLVHRQTLEVEAYRLPKIV